MAAITDAVLDLSLAELTASADTLHLCTSEPTNYTDILTKDVGTKTSLSVSSPGARPGGGRRVTITGFIDGSGIANGNATWYALSNGTDTMLAKGELGATLAVENGGTFALPTFYVGIGPAA